jgi:hypothetical protein
MNRVGNSLLHFGGNEELVRALCDHAVEFLVIGGLAVAWYCPDRQADDLDVLVNPTRENARRIAAVAATLGVVGIREDSFGRPGVRARLDRRFYADLLTPRSIDPTYEVIARGCEHARLFGYSVKIASIESLILMKSIIENESTTDAGKHAADLRRLKAALLDRHGHRPPTA